MNSAFPPNSTHASEIDDLIAVFAAVGEGRNAIYVSTPLTSGPRHSAWSVRAGLDPSDPRYSAELREQVVEPNRIDARQFAEHLRETERRVVIDPGALEDIDGWTQDDYRLFWGRVIERYASTVVFRAGWEHSHGCSYEFLVAVRSGATLLDAQLRPLSVTRGLELVDAAVVECELRGIPMSFLSQVAAALHELVGKEDPER